MRSTPSWSIVAELRKQYDVVEITPSGPITEELDGVVVVLPSSLTQDQMDHVQAYIEEGHPALLLVDPLPVVNIGLAPSEQQGDRETPSWRRISPHHCPRVTCRACSPIWAFAGTRRLSLGTPTTPIPILRTCRPR